MYKRQDKKIELANIELANRVKELELKNKDLEEHLKNSNDIVTGFNTVKGELDSKIENLNKTVIELNNDIKEKDKIIQDKNKEIINSSKTIDNMEKEIALIKEQKVIFAGKNSSLQVTNELEIIEWKMNWLPLKFELKSEFVEKEKLMTGEKMWQDYCLSTNTDINTKHDTRCV